MNFEDISKENFKSEKEWDGATVVRCIALHEDKPCTWTLRVDPNPKGFTSIPELYREKHLIEISKARFTCKLCNHQIMKTDANQASRYFDLVRNHLRRGHRMWDIWIKLSLTGLNSLTCHQDILMLDWAFIWFKNNKLMIMSDEMKP